MKRLPLLVLVAMGSIGLTSAAEAGEGEIVQTPPATLTGTTYLNPLYLGGEVGAVAADAGGHLSTQSLTEACWRAWASNRNWQIEVNEEAGEPLPFPELAGASPVSGVGSGPSDLPAYCRGKAAKFTSPGLGGRECPYGTVHVIDGRYRWLPPSGPGGMGRFIWQGLISAELRLAFSSCLDLFSDQPDIAGFLEGVPEPALEVSPPGSGITGMDTWLSYDFRDPASHSITGSATVRTIPNLPLTLQAEAWVDKVQWDLDGDGTWDATLDLPDERFRSAGHEVYVAAGGGANSEDAAATHRFEIKGTYPIATAVVWRGVYSFPGWAETPIAYPPVTRINTTQYDVAEIRSLVVSGSYNP